jgi:hypothetical protein
MNKILISTLLGLAFSANAHANIITVEPDSFANGANISNATAGVLLQMETGNSVYSYDTGDANYASTGTKVFGYDAGFGVEPYWDNQNIFRASFSALTDYVAIDVINNNGAGQGTDNAYMQVFGASGLLTTIASPAIGFPGYQTLSFQSSSANISYIRVSSLDGSDFNLDRLQFSTQMPVPVPESGLLALMGISALGFFSRREKQG